MADTGNVEEKSMSEISYTFFNVNLFDSDSESIETIINENNANLLSVSEMQNAKCTANVSYGNITVTVEDDCDKIAETVANTVKIISAAFQIAINTVLSLV